MPKTSGASLARDGGSKLPGVCQKQGYNPARSWCLDYISHGELADASWTKTRRRDSRFDITPPWSGITSLHFFHLYTFQHRNHGRDVHARCGRDPR